MKKIVAEICLYGSAASKFGWLVMLADGSMLGDGNPKYESATESVWSACDAIHSARKDFGGNVKIFASGGKQMATTSLCNPGYYGDMKWEPATVYIISAAAIIAASESPAN